MALARQRPGRRYGCTTARMGIGVSSPRRTCSPTGRQGPATAAAKGTVASSGTIFGPSASGSTARPAATSPIAGTAEPGVSISAASVGHSACQPPRARSCSCGKRRRWWRPGSQRKAPISRGSALSKSAAVGIARPDAGFLELAQLLLGDAGVLVLDPLAPLLAAAVAQPEDGGLGVGREVAVVFDLLGPALDLQDLHVLVGKTLGLLQQRMGDVGVGDVAAILRRLPELGIAGEPIADGVAGDLEQLGEVFVGGAQQAELVGDGAVIRRVRGCAAAFCHGVDTPWISVDRDRPQDCARLSRGASRGSSERSHERKSLDLQLITLSARTMTLSGIA